MSAGVDQPAAPGEETTRSVAGETPLKRWILLEGHRLVIVGVLSIGLFVSCVVLSLANVIPMAKPDPVTSMTSAIVGGTLPLITIVLVINQLVLSEELGSTSELRQRMSDMREFRREVEEMTDIRVSPTAPADFLGVLVEAIQNRSRELKAACTDAQVEDPNY